MKLIKMRRTGKLVEVGDKRALLFVEKLRVASYVNKTPVVKKPIPSKSTDDEPGPEIRYFKNNIEVEDIETNTYGNPDIPEDPDDGEVEKEEKKPKKRKYKRRDMKAEESID